MHTAALVTSENNTEQVRPSLNITVKVLSKLLASYSSIHEVNNLFIYCCVYNLWIVLFAEVSSFSCTIDILYSLSLLQQ